MRDRFGLNKGEISRQDVFFRKAERGLNANSPEFPMLARSSLNCLYTVSIDLTKSKRLKSPFRSGRNKRMRDLILASTKSPFAFVASTDTIENGSTGSESSSNLLNLLDGGAATLIISRSYLIGSFHWRGERITSACEKEAKLQITEAKYVHFLGRLYARLPSFSLSID